MKRPHVVLIGHYATDGLDRAPKVRIHQMAAAFQRIGSVTTLACYRAERRDRLRPLLNRVDWSQVDGVYVESASSTAIPADIAFLRGVRRRGVPVGIFVRDAYQFFPELYPPKGLKGRVLSGLYRLTLSAYARYATMLFVPSDGLSAAIRQPRAQTLPPGVEWRPRPASVGVRPNQVIYVGAGGAHDGVDRLVAAMTAVHDRRPDARLVLVMRPNEALGLSFPPFVTRISASGQDLSSWLWSSQLAAIPRVNTAYHQLAMPVKLFDYLGHGLPVLTTGPSEAASLVKAASVGWVTDDRVDAMAQGLLRALDEPIGGRMSSLSAFARENTWDARARTVLTAFAMARP